MQVQTLGLQQHRMKFQYFLFRRQLGERLNKKKQPRPPSFYISDSQIVTYKYSSIGYTKLMVSLLVQNQLMGHWCITQIKLLTRTKNRLNLEIPQVQKCYQILVMDKQSTFFKAEHVWKHNQVTSRVSLTWEDLFLKRKKRGRRFMKLEENPYTRQQTATHH